MIPLHRNYWLMLPSILFYTACGTPPSETDNFATHAPAAPLIGVDGSKDQADTRCQVILRSMERIPNDMGGYQTRDGHWIWRATIDVSEAAVNEGLEPVVLYQNGNQGWRTQEATLTTPSSNQAGYARFVADVWEGMPTEGMSGTSLQNVVVRVIPYLVLSEGGRLFDHNRIADPLGTYEIRGTRGLAIGSDAAVCPPPAPKTAATIRFTRTEIEQLGALEAGQRLTIEYDITRLETCRGTHNGYPAWDLLAHARFFPGRQQVQGSVRAFESPNGVPTNVAKSVAFTTDIPSDASAVEIWFENFTGAGSSCRAWDSNNSQNFRFSVLSPVGWMGNQVAAITRGGPACAGSAMTEGFTYETWARQRAAYRNVCFEVWKRGVTDYANPNLWREVSVQAFYRFDSSQPFESTYVSIFDRVGNNARYAFDLSALDPFRPYRCTTEPYELTSDGYDTAMMEFYFTANGTTLRKADGSNFIGVFKDYPGSHNCP